jgi:hypothetical protein
VNTPRINLIATWNCIESWSHGWAPGIPTHNSALTCLWVCPIAPVEIAQVSVCYVGCRGLGDLSGQILEFIRICWYITKCNNTTLCGSSAIERGELVGEEVVVISCSTWSKILLNEYLASTSPVESNSNHTWPWLAIHLIALWRNWPCSENGTKVSWSSVNRLDMHLIICNHEIFRVFKSHKFYVPRLRQANDLDVGVVGTIMNQKVAVNVVIYVWPCYGPQ